MDKFCLKQAVFKGKEELPLSNGTCGRRSVFCWVFYAGLFPTPWATTVQPQNSENSLRNFAQTLEHGDTHTQPCPALSTRPDFQNLPGRRLFCMPRTHTGGLGAFTRRARVITPQFLTCMWASTSDGPGLTTMGHDHAHITEAMGGDIFLSLLLSLFLSFSLLNFPILRWSYTLKQLFQSVTLFFFSQLWF